MASVKFTIDVVAADGESPITSARKQTALNLRNWFKKRASGNHQGTDTVSCRAGAVSAAAVVTCATVANADTVTVNGQALTATQHNSRGTATAASVSVADTITLNGVVLTGIKQRASGTVTAATAIAGNTVVVDGVTFTGATGAVVLGEATFSVDTGNTQTATSLAAQINGHPVTAAKLTATSASAVVTLRAVSAGTAGNALTLTSSGSTVAVSAATLTGGIAVANNQFDVSPGATNTQVAADIVRCINASTSVLLSGIVTADNAAAVVTIRSVAAGTGGDAITLVSSNGSRLAVSGSGTLTGGAAVANNQYDFGGTNTQTAAALAAAINASTTDIVSKHVIATSSGAAMTVTALVPGHSGNAISIATGNGTRLAITGSVSRLAGGTETLTTHTF